MRLPPFLFLLALLTGCGSDAPAVVATYDVRGVYVGPQYNGEAAVIQHEAIPGFMEAMQMTFRLADAASLAEVPVGAKIRFELVVTETSSFIQNIQPLPDSTVLDLEALHPENLHLENPDLEE